MTWDDWSSNEQDEDLIDVAMEQTGTVGPLGLRKLWLFDTRRGDEEPWHL